MREKVYNFKNTNLNVGKLLELGYSWGEGFLYKTIKFNFEDEPSKSFVQTFNSKNFAEQVLDKEAIKFLRKAGIKYDRNGKLIENDKLKEVASTWHLEIIVDGYEVTWVGFTTDLINYPVTFYNSGLIEKYCPELLKELIDNDCVELIEVENDA